MILKAEKRQGRCNWFSHNGVLQAGASSWSSSASLEPGAEVTTIKRRIQIENDLYFEYEVSPHRAILARRSGIKDNYLSGEVSNEVRSQSSNGDSTPIGGERVTGLHIPFKQVRLRGKVNPLKPPLHVETVLIGRALGQQTGYLAGVGFRIRDDGYVEGEFVQGAQKFLSFGDFEEAVKNCLEKTSENND